MFKAQGFNVEYGSNICAKRLDSIGDYVLITHVEPWEVLKGKVKNQIKQFLNRKIKKFTFKTKTIGSKTQLKVWNEIKKINYAKTVSYNFISKKTKLHPRHVGRICGQNRLLLFIPCHRVIRSSGLIGGFSAKGGVNLKNKILKFEKLNK